MSTAIQSVIMLSTSTIAESEAALTVLGDSLDHDPKFNESHITDFYSTWIYYTEPRNTTTDVF